MSNVNNKLFSFKVSYYIISKIFFALYVIYTQALNYTSYYIPRASLMLIGATVFFYLLGTKRIYKDRFILCYVGFVLYSLITGFIIVVDKTPFMMSIRNLLEYFLSFYLIYAYSKQDRNIYYSCNVFICLAFTMSILNLTMGQGVNRITFSEDLNVNTIAIVMMFAIGFVLYCLIQEKVRLKSWIIGFALIALFGYMILITVSKKAILGTAFLLLVWALWCSGKDNSLGTLRKILIFCAVMIGLYYGYELFVKFMPTQYQYLMLRMSQLSEGSSSDKRRDLIIQGFNVFLQNPVFGVGLNNFRYYTPYNTYSHCFYSELFSCLGIFGVLIFFIPFIRGVATLMQQIRMSYDSITKNKLKYIFAILGCLMGTSIAQIIFYEYELIFILAVICSSQCIYEEQFIQTT